MNINSIQLSIGSAFTGEGFQKAKAAVMDVNNNVKRAAGDATRLAGAFGEMDASAAKAMGAATGLVHALASFSITTIAVQGTMMAINLYLGELRERADAAKKKADELAASVKAAFDSTLTTRMGALQKEVKDIGDGFERVAKQAKSFSDALEGVRSSQAAGGIASLEVEKLNKMLEAHTDAERITIEKSYALLVAQARLTEAEQAGAEKIQAVTDEMQTNQKRLGVIDDQLAKLREDRAQLEEAMFSAKASEDKNWLEIQKRVNELKAQEETLEQKRIDTENAAEILELKLQKTKEDANTAQLNATAAVKQAELAQRDAAKQIQDRADKEKLAAAASEEQKLKDAELRDAKYTYTEKLKDAATIQKEANDAAKALEAAQRAYMSALDGYMSSGAALSGVFGANKSGMGKSGAIPVNVVRGVSMQVSDARAGARQFAQSTRINQVDLADLALRIGSSEGKQLAQAIQDCVKYNGTTITKCYGLSIYFPYESMSSVSSAINTYDTLGLDEEYAKVIKSFASLEYGGQVGSSASGYGSYGSGSFSSGGYGDLLSTLLGGYSYAGSSSSGSSPYGSSSPAGSLPA